MYTLLGILGAYILALKTFSTSHSLLFPSWYNLNYKYVFIYLISTRMFFDFFFLFGLFSIILRNHIAIPGDAQGGTKDQT